MYIRLSNEGFRIDEALAAICERVQGRPIRVMRSQKKDLALDLKDSFFGENRGEKVLSAGVTQHKKKVWGSRGWVVKDAKGKNATAYTRS